VTILKPSHKTKFPNFEVGDLICFEESCHGVVLTVKEEEYFVVRWFGDIAEQEVVYTRDDWNVFALVSRPHPL
jgi:hypothetical protein